MDRHEDRERGGREEHLVVFRLAGEHYGVDIATVREIITWQPVTRLPNTPPYVEGVTNLRGNIIPVIDLRRRLGFDEAPRSRETRIMVVEIAGHTVGLVVDAVTEVLQVPAGAIEPPSDIALGSEASSISGVAKVGERLILLLDLAAAIRPEALQAGAADGGSAGSLADPAGAHAAGASDPAGEPA